MEFAVENLLFWREVEYFKQIDDPVARKNVCYEFLSVILVLKTLVIFFVSPDCPTNLHSVPTKWH
jgi:hypothetical protein